MPDFSKFLKGSKDKKAGSEKSALPALTSEVGAVKALLNDIRPTAIDPAAQALYSASAEKGAAAGFTPGRRGRFAILLDATGSMAGLLNDARRSLGDIVARIQSEARVEVAIQFIIYRDYEDGADLLAVSPEATSAQPLLSWLATISAKGGDDAPEAVEAALAHVLSGEEFDAVLLAGDAPSHSRENLLRKGKAQSRTAHELSLEFGRKKVPIHTFVVGADPVTIMDFAVIARQSGGSTGRLDGSDAMRDMAVMAMLERIKGRSAVKAYMDRYDLLSGPVAAFGNALLLEDKR